MRWHEIFENTSSSNIATCVGAGGKGGIGSGFDPDGDWGVYQSAKGKIKKTKTESATDGVLRR